MTDGYVGDGETLPKTPEEALDLLAGFVGSTESAEEREDIDKAFEILDVFIKQVLDLEWGEPGDCWDRIERDYEDDAELMRLVAIATEVGGGSVEAEAAVIDKAKAKGYGRHYGDPHCIWCLQAS